MSNQTRVSHPIYSLLPTEVDGFDSLAELALDMRWSWNHATDKVWRQLDPALWELTQNPWVVLQTVSRDVVNGGINLSELDGWWAEAYAPEVGWALGDGQEHGDDPAWDAAEAVALYERLEREVIPEFYARDEQGIPTAWVARMRESMARLTPRFCANRTVCEYAEQHYLPAATAYRERAADKGVIGRQIVDWQHGLDQKWAALRFDGRKVETRGEQHVFEAQVYLNDLDPKAVRVELYADGINGADPVRQEMKRLRPLAGASGGYAYAATVPGARPAADYTARVIPHCEGVAIPLEDARILWQR
jgi:glycogen phosphorylase